MRSKSKASLKPTKLAFKSQAHGGKRKRELDVDLDMLIIKFRGEANDINMQRSEQKASFSLKTDASHTAEEARGEDCIADM